MEFHPVHSQTPVGIPVQTSGFFPCICLSFLVLALKIQLLHQIQNLIVCSARFDYLNLLRHYNQKNIQGRKLRQMWGLPYLFLFSAESNYFVSYFPVEIKIVALCLLSGSRRASLGPVILSWRVVKIAGQFWHIRSKFFSKLYLPYYLFDCSTLYVVIAHNPLKEIHKSLGLIFSIWNFLWFYWQFTPWSLFLQLKEADLVLGQGQDLLYFVFLVYICITIHLWGFSPFADEK